MVEGVHTSFQAPIKYQLSSSTVINSASLESRVRYKLGFISSILRLLYPVWVTGYEYRPVSGL
jgi:hypothetical protein